MRIFPPGLALSKLVIVLALITLLSSCGEQNQNSSEAEIIDATVGTDEHAKSVAQLVLQFPAQPDNEYSAASRFLAQATFGPTSNEIFKVARSGYEDWITEQFSRSITSMREDFDAQQAANPTSAPSRDWVFEAWWLHAVTAPDQLRQRVAFALSQIFVISLREGAVAGFPRGVADFQSVLTRNAFGNFRQLLEEVTLHPMMGAYLSHLGNEKGDPVSGRVPDENFAREIMQLFTIGLRELNPDGTPRLNDLNEPIETYTTADVQGLAKVFTGFSWGGPDTATGRFQGWMSVPERDVLPMQAYPQFHSTNEKSFLGVTIDAQTVPDPLGDLRIALDTLFNHPNVGPFIGRQLIQRLVTSNPSDEYTGRVAAAFSDNGEGVRGDMKAVIRAILLDPEARDLERRWLPETGRIREPVLRMTHWMRSFAAQSASGRYKMFATDNPATSLGMTPYRSPSVFNFYRPGYVPANTAIAEADLVAPEMQITHETSVAGYLNSTLSAVYLGTGFINDISSEHAAAAFLADEPEELLDHINLLLLHGVMSDTLRDLITEAVLQIEIPAQPLLARQQAMLDRANLAIYLAMSSPEYIVLK